MFEEDIKIITASTKAAQRAYRKNDKVALEAALSQLRRRIKYFFEDVEESLDIVRDQMDAEAFESE